ncbi:MAG: serine/threonine-protein kinase, partial [Myxococcota bacterium]
MQGSTTDPVGSTLAGRYQILREQGAESLGAVWVGRDTRTQQLVQIKLLPPEMATDRVKFARFGREMTASFLVSQPNTVEVLDYGQDATTGMHFLVLEFLAARTLADELGRTGPLDQDRVATIAAQIALALGAAHQENIVHRALSPENVLLLTNVRNGEFVKVRDFGLAKLTTEVEQADDDASEVTATGLRVGDPRYMPPEYVAKGEYTAKGDLYALGAVMFHMVAGRPPFQGSRSQLLTQHVSTPAPSLAGTVSGVPPWLDALVAALLEKNPADRPGVHAVVNAIQDGVGYGLVMGQLVPLDADGNLPRAEEAPA